MLSTLFAAAIALSSASDVLAAPFQIRQAGVDIQSSPVLDPSQIQPGLSNNGQQTPEAGQVASATSNNNFINFCATQSGVPLTNGEQIKTGSCNPTIMGRILATDKLPSSKFQFPANGGTVPAQQTFTIKMAIQNMVTGNFVNAQANYYSAPCQVDGTGTVIGHSHVVVEKLDSLGSTTVTNPTTFAFFKGLNAAAVGGVLTADVTGGLAPGAYRLASINTCANHQPVLGSVAQHGSFDDMVYFTAVQGGAGGGNNGGNNGTNNGGAGAPPSTSVAPPVSTLPANAANPAASQTTSSPASISTPPAGGIAAPPVTGPDAKGRFNCDGQTFSNKTSALKHSCSVQNDACKKKAEQTGNLGNLNQKTCRKQLQTCQAA